MDLGKRFQTVNSRMMAENQQREKEEARQRGAQKLYDSYSKEQETYDMALGGLNRSIVNWIEVFDGNVCVYTNDGYWVLIREEHFDDKLTTKQKEQSYRCLRKHLRKKEILQGEQSPKPKMEPLVQGGHFLLQKAIPESAASFLYKLTGGNTETLMDFSKLYASIMKTGASLKPIVVLADKKIHASLRYFFECLLGETFPELELNDFLKNQWLVTLYEKNLNVPLNRLSPCAAIITEGKIPESETSVNKLNDLMSGKKISANHPSFPGKIQVKNCLPFLFITEHHEKYLKLKNIYHAIGMKVTAKEPLVFQGTDVEWLREVFVALGEKVIKKTNTKVVCTPKISEDDIFDAFVEKLCVLDSNAICAKADLYEAYWEFYKKYYGDEPLTKTTFGRRFACFGNFETVRPHSSRTGSYRYCFKGITIDKEKYETFKESVNVTQYTCAYEVFKEWLRETIKENFSSKTDMRVSIARR